MDVKEYILYEFLQLKLGHYKPFQRTLFATDHASPPLDSGL